MDNFGFIARSHSAPSAAASPTPSRSQSPSPVDEEYKLNEPIPFDMLQTDSIRTEVVSGLAAESVPTTSGGHSGRQSPLFEIQATLDKIPLLKQLSMADRDDLARGFQEVHYKSGDVVFRQGQRGSNFFLIKRGSAVVCRSNSPSQPPQNVASLKASDYFGEQALINKTQRDATVVASGDLVCLKLDSANFQSLRKLNVRFAKRGAISAESLSLLRRKIFKDRIRKKSAETRDFLRDSLRSHMLFSELGESQHQRIVDEMYRIKVAKGTKLIVQGTRGDNFYVVEQGRFKISIQQLDGTTQVVQHPGVGDSFGELALMYGTRRQASVEATEDSVVWAVDRYVFRTTMVTISEERLQKHESFLAKVDLFSPLLANERTKIAEALERVIFRSGEDVVKEGEEGDCFFLVAEGEAVATKLDSKGRRVEVQVYRPGDFFGERALLANERRAATVTARGRLTCLTLAERAFSMLLGPLSELMHRKVRRYDRLNAEEKLQSPYSPTCKYRSEYAHDDATSSSQKQKASSSSSSRAHTADIPFDDLMTIGTLGKGSFGHVKLVRDKRTGLTYALKAVSRKRIVELGQQEHIINEKKIMQQLECTFLIRLHDTYKSPEHLYFLQEVALGGELFDILRRANKFDVKTAKFYAACVVLGFEHMHKKKIIYRDLKPENLLLDDEGYLKITDFGFAKYVPERTHTLCGTPDYLAPEIVLGRGHGKGVDWWTLGILTFEMLAGYAPFTDKNDQMVTYLNIVKHRLTFPRHFPKSAIDLIEGLLDNNPARRLGMTATGVDGIKQHKFFKGFAWDSLEARKLKAPIRPKVRDAEDLSNFPEEREGPASRGSSNAMAYVDDGTGWADDF